MNYWKFVPFWTLRLAHFHHSSVRSLLLVKFHRKMAPNPYTPYIYIYIHIHIIICVYIYIHIYIYTHYIHCCWYPIISHDINQAPEFSESPRLDSPAQNIASHGSRSHRNLSLSSNLQAVKKRPSMGRWKLQPIFLGNLLYIYTYIHICTYIYYYIIYIYYIIIYYIYYIYYILLYIYYYIYIIILYILLYYIYILLLYIYIYILLYYIYILLYYIYYYTIYFIILYIHYYIIYIYLYIIYICIIILYILYIYTYIIYILLYYIYIWYRSNLILCERDFFRIWIKLYHIESLKCHLNVLANSSPLLSSWRHGTLSDVTPVLHPILPPTFPRFLSSFSEARDTHCYQ